MPPHYDAEGRRQTRQGRSTRALTDDELLRIYLDREAGSFAARFRQTSDELQSAVGTVGTQVDQIAQAINMSIAQPILELTATTRRAASAAAAASDAATSAEEASSSAANAASSAESTADSVGFDVRKVEELVSDLYDVVEVLRENAPESLAVRVVAQRRDVWWKFTADTWERTSDQAQRLARQLNELLSGEIALDDARNTWELRVWKHLLSDRETQRGQRGTLKWWNAVVKTVNEYSEQPAYQAPELPDLRAELQADLDRAMDDETSETNRFRKLLES